MGNHCVEQFSTTKTFNRDASRSADAKAIFQVAEEVDAELLSWGQTTRWAPRLARRLSGNPASFSKCRLY